MPGTGSVLSEVVLTMISSWLNKLALGACSLGGLCWGLEIGI